MFVTQAGEQAELESGAASKQTEAVLSIKAHLNDRSEYLSELFAFYKLELPSFFDSPHKW